MPNPELKIVRRPSISEQARLAVAEYKAARAGSHPLSNAEVRRVDELTIIEVVNGETTIDNYDWRRQFTWSNIFNAKLPLTRDGAARLAREAGYRFFSFASEIYFVSCKGIVEHAGLSADEVA